MREIVTYGSVKRNRIRTVSAKLRGRERAGARCSHSALGAVLISADWNEAGQEPERLRKGGGGLG